jgi:cysteine synthase B
MNVFDLVGNTPLLEIKNITENKNVKIFAKAEFMNPSGSVKDRAARAMLLDGLNTGHLTEGKTIIDATSGNTGISYSMLGAALGYRVQLCMPENVSTERKKIIRAHGAEIIETAPLEGVDGAYYKVQKIVSENPDKYFYPDQYSNIANWSAHYNTTGPEIWRQTGGSVTHFIVGTGTSGTFTGTARALKKFNSKIKTYYMQLDSPFHGIEGLKLLETTMKPKIFDESVADGKIEISTETAYKVGIRLAMEEGLFVGISSGANVAAALKLAEKAPDGSVIVTVLCDGGERYFSSPMWEGYL